MKKEIHSETNKISEGVERFCNELYLSKKNLSISKQEDMNILREES